MNIECKFFLTAVSKCIALVLAVLLCTGINLCGQDHYDRLVIGDLKEEFEVTTDVPRKALILYDICLYFQVKDYQVDSVFHYARNLISFADQSSYPPAAVLGHRMLGSQYVRINKSCEGRVHLYESIALAQANSYYWYIHDSYSPLGSSYANENRLDSALFYYNKCIDIAPKDMYSKHANFHGLVAEVYNMLDRDDKQEEHLLLGYKNAVAAKINLDQLIALTYILDFYSINKQDAVSYNFYKRKYDLVAANFKDPTASYHANFIFIDSLPYEERTAFLENALIDNMQTRYGIEAYLNVLQLQKEYLEAKDYKKCVAVSKAAVDFHSQGNPGKIEIFVDLYLNKWTAESKLSDPTAAFETIEIYHDLRDSLVERNNARYVNELSIKYETAQKDREIANSLVKANKRTAQRNYALLVSVALLTLGFFTWRRSRYQQQKVEAENKLQAEKILNFENEKRILGLASMIEGQESERKRIAQDLHDGLGGLLSSVRNQFSLVKDDVKKIDKHNVYDRTNEMIDKACREVRRISHNLMPASLQLNGLLGAVEQYCQDVKGSAKLEVVFQYIGADELRLDETKEIFIYRIIQEAVANVIKHADATNLLVQLGLYDTEITLIIEDDGCGFENSENSENSDGIGLRSIRSRVDHLQGHIDIDSRISAGTTITINIPYVKN